MFFVLSKLLDVLLSPLTWALVAFAAAIPWRRPSRRTWRRRRAAGLLGLAILLFFSSRAVSNRIWWWMERNAVSTYRSDATYDVVVLLGGVGDERVWAVTGEPALNENVERLTVTHQLLRDGRARYAIVSGGANYPELHAFNEAALLRVVLTQWGIPEERILLEDKAKNTRENAVYSAAIIRERGFSRVLVVTSAFHTARARETFLAVGLDPDFLAVDFRAYPPPPLSLAEILPRSDALHDSTAALRELFGKYIYRLRGYGRR